MGSTLSAKGTRIEAPKGCPFCVVSFCPSDLLVDLLNFGRFLVRVFLPTQVTVSGWVLFWGMTHVHLWSVSQNVRFISGEEDEMFLVVPLLPPYVFDLERSRTRKFLVVFWR